MQDKVTSRGTTDTYGNLRDGAAFLPPKPLLLKPSPPSLTPKGKNQLSIAGTKLLKLGKHTSAHMLLLTVC